MQRNPKAYIRIKGNGFDFSCFLGNGRPTPTGGGAEYEAQRRPQSDAATLFVGNGLLTMDVPVLFDGWGSPGDRRDIGPRIDQVLALTRGVGRRPPPNFVATFPGPFSGSRFQMLMPEYVTDEPKPIIGSGGAVFRQALVLKLIEFNDPTSAKYRARPSHAIPHSHNGGVTAPPFSIVLKHPETLLEVAAEVYGDASAASAIGDVNGIRDVRKKLKAGTRLKLPKSFPNPEGG